MKKFLTFLFVLILLGCDEDKSQCEKVMICEDDKEMFCTRTDSGCGENCHYFTYEQCYERCKGDESW